MIKKHKIFTGESDNFTIIGIVSRLVDYKLCFHINNALNIGLKRGSDISVMAVKTHEVQHFPLFRYYSEQYKNNWILIPNKNLNKDILLADLQPIDYFFFIDEFPSLLDIKDLMRTFKNIPEVALVKQIKPQASKRIDHILQDIEIYLLSQNQKKEM